MKSDKNIATPKEILDELESHNLVLLFHDLVTYALNQMKGNDVVSAEKLVGDIFEKTVTGVRKWNKSYSFKSFLFLAVKSLISQYNDQYGGKVMSIDYEVKLENFSGLDSGNSVETEALKVKLSKRLSENIPPPDEIEGMIFESWMDEMKKPQYIADFWKLDIKEVYKGIKRLERKLNPIRELLNSKSNE